MIRETTLVVTVPRLSVTLTTKEYDPETVGVPLMSPAPLKDKPLGNELAKRLHV